MRGEGGEGFGEGDSMTCTIILVSGFYNVKRWFLSYKSFW